METSRTQLELKDMSQIRKGCIPSSSDASQILTILTDLLQSCKKEDGEMDIDNMLKENL